MISKSLILCPGKFSLYNVFYSVLSTFSAETVGFDVKAAIGNKQLIMNTQLMRVPYKFRSIWEKQFLARANKLVMNEINRIKPELVLVYNSEYLLPETCLKIKEKSKLIFFLGDSPFYTHQNDYYLKCLSYADLLLVPDTFWLQQLNTVGLDKTLYFIPGIDSMSYFQYDKRNDNESGGKTDILYVGASYKNSWGYKKALLMSKFTGFNFRLYGNNAWERWFRFFPDLERAFERTSYIPTEKLNLMFNNSKIIPVDGNPAIINGAHLRIMEALGSGTLPITEYRLDVENEIFSGCNFSPPMIRDYNKAAELADYWLTHENERQQIAEAMRLHVLKKYSSENNAFRLNEPLGFK